MNLRQINEMLAYLKAIDEKLASVLGILQWTLRHSDQYCREDRTGSSDELTETNV